jgi:hypothetical protein
MMSSFSFCLSWKVIILPSCLKDSFIGHIILGCHHFLFEILNMLYHFLLKYQVSAEKFSVSLKGILLNATWYFCCS